MNEQNRQKVTNYLQDVDTNPLYFPYHTSRDGLCDCKDLREMVSRIGELNRNNESYNFATKERECDPEHYRSLLDIWRHLIYYKPEISIFDVMHELYSLYHVQDIGFAGQFCTTIMRRTFIRYKNANDIPNPINWMSPELIAKECGVPYDEFGLVWEDWKDI